MSRQSQFVLSIILMLIGVLIFVAITSYLATWRADQSILSELSDKQVTAKNWLGKLGAHLSHLLVFKGFGIASVIIPVLIFLGGWFIFLRLKRSRYITILVFGLISMVWLSVLLASLPFSQSVFSGITGLEIVNYLNTYIGRIGTIGLLFITLASVLIFRFKWLPEHLLALFNRSKSGANDNTVTEQDIPEEKTDVYTPKEDIIADTNTATTPPIDLDLTNTTPLDTEPQKQVSKDSATDKGKKDDDELEIEVNDTEKEEVVEENLSDRLVKDFGEFDPTLDLSQFKFPTLDMLKSYSESIAVNPEELQQNKDRIVETLNNYNIGISHIKATVGPTVTLYEIIPQAGIRISKIKNLEDDIALSLSALGIRIIAPIPGKGTIGIEVPNKKPTIVSMRSVIASEKFQNAEMELPLALGKTITNETFVVDLAKMPHLLMAGATGQGKSVGINAILTSLLYKKHPAEVKFVLVDPKKVELALYNKIERHYLAKLPDTDDAIITDTTRVVNTLNSLCLEMDERYNLLQKAMVRGIKEYNHKFKTRQLNPENGHRFLPYIVLVIDEFADLIMTAGKEIETPIARLAQLARAIGIHLIVATQRPSVNVITGIIKANFPARVAYRVTAKIDSRTILDSQGADQLIGKGDMLYSGRNELIRLQCAFIDTPEVEKIVDFIGSQRGYSDAHMLPEYISDDSGMGIDIDIDDRDQLFEEAAYVIVKAQQGSASLLQRKLKLGYNRAGRIIDQLEAAGIVGPFEGSKARQVLIPDEIALKQYFDNETNH